MYPDAVKDSADMNFLLIPIKQEVETLFDSEPLEPGVDPPDSAELSEFNQSEDTNIKFEESVRETCDPRIDILHCPRSYETSISRNAKGQVRDIEPDRLNHPIPDESSLYHSVDSQHADMHDSLTPSLEMVQVHLKTESDWSLEEAHGDQDSQISDGDGQTCCSLQGRDRTCCGVCGKSLSSAKALRRHMLTHTGEKPYLCSECGKSFRQSAHLADHLLTHANDKQQTCYICGKSFKRRSYLQNHLLTHNPDSRRFGCELCGKDFLRNDDLKRHVMGHDDERPYPCQICGKRFKQKPHLKGHLTTHLKKMKFDCVTCHKSFKTKEDIQKHYESHLECQEVHLPHL